MDTTDEDRNAYIESLLDALEKSKAIRLHLEEIISSLHSDLEQERLNRENVEAELVRLQEHALCMREAQQDEIEELEEAYKSNTNAVKRVIELETELDEMKMKFKHLSDITREKTMQSNNVESINREEITRLENENKRLASMIGEFESKDNQLNYQAKVIQDLLQQQSAHDTTVQVLNDKISKLKRTLRSSMQLNGSNNAELSNANFITSNDSLARGINARNGQMTYRVSSSEYSSKTPSDSECDNSYDMDVPKHFMYKLWKNFINVCKENYMFLNSEISSLYKNREYCMISLDGSNTFLGTKLPSTYNEPIISCLQSPPAIFKLNSDYTLTFCSTNSPYVGYKLGVDRHCANAVLSKDPKVDHVVFQSDDSVTCILKIRSKNLYLGLLNDPFSHPSNVLGLATKYNYTPANSNYSYVSKSHDSDYTNDPSEDSFDNLCPSTSASDKSYVIPYKSNEVIEENVQIGFVPFAMASKFKLITLEDYLNLQAKREAQQMMDVKTEKFDAKLGSSDWVIVPEITAFTLAR